MRQRVQDEWGVELYEYTSAADTGTAWECREHDGFHLWEDTVFAECLQPSGNEPVVDGELGELVATDLDNRAAPLIRYRSADMVRLARSTCPCGRTHARMWVAGRLGDEPLVQGRPVMLRDVWNAVEAEPETAAGMFQIVRSAREVERLCVRVGYEPAATADTDDLAERLRAGISERTGVEADLELRTEEELMSTVRSVAKFPRVVGA
ncbi:phenylacetate--CoA ligase family protein [Actinomadura sp. LOL_016]|uniref:phenylacetate--CoA ligase family protein n=1 Tax=unclassified Actinomadura TaxID=2626254 RepID=UPI003A7F9D2F